MADSTIVGFPTLGTGVVTGRAPRGGYSNCNDRSLTIEAMLLVLAVWAFAGFHGNDWRRSKLSRRGFTYAGTYQADTHDAALRTLN